MIGLLAALVAGPAHAQSAPDNWKFTLDGYFRTRGYVYAGLFPGQAKPGTMFMSRARLQPGLDFEDRAKFFMTIDALDGVVWGDNQSVASTALFAGDPTTTGLGGTDMDALKLKRIWTEFRVPVGVVRVGRQGSHWGMGLLANEGNGFDDPFGENHYGSTYDRVLFATRPITIAQTIMGKKHAKEIPLLAVVAVDRLVEDPLIQYYGYQCDPEDPDDDARCADTDDHGFTEERDADRRQDTWWVDTQDDVWEMVYAAIYRGEGLKLGKTVGDLTAGVYVVNRMQQETDSNVVIVDGYVKAEVSNVLVEGELLHIGGKTEAITLGNPDPDVENPLYKEANIWGYAVKAGYQSEGLTALLEHGYASGDSNVDDVQFTGRPLHPDYNVGILLYEEVMARVTAATWGDAAAGLWSNGGVYNSRYLYPQVRYRPLKNWELSGAFLVAFPDQPDGVRIYCAETDEVDCLATPATSSILGWETDFALKHKWHDHMNFSLEAAYAHVTDRVPLESAGLAFKVTDDGKEVGNFFTVQSRIAYEF